MSTTEPQSVCEAFQNTVARYPDAVALRTPGDGVVITWRQYAERVRRIAAGLAALGVRRGDTVGIMLTNRPEFHLVDTGALHAGATPFSVYNTLAPEQLRYVLGNAGNRIMVCERQFLPVLRDAIPGTAVEHIVCVDAGPEVGSDGAGSSDVMSLAELEERGDPGFDFEASWRTVQPEDLVTINYTSGTTGPPKGVELTHLNLLAQRDAGREVLRAGPDDRIVSYLPDAHIANRLFAHYLAISEGIQVTTLADMKQAAAVLPKVRPTIFLAVPQVWYKIKAGIDASLQAEPSAVKRRLARWGIEVGRRVARMESDEVPVPATLRAEHAIAERLVLSAVREKMGMGDVRLTLSSAASISPEVLEFVLGLGIPCCEAWGLSETAGGVTVNRPDHIHIGTVGQTMKDVQMRLGDDGEVLIAGPMVMRGYHGDPARTAEAIDPDGWLHTGDIGAVDSDGYLRIIDRKKELIISAAGKNMSPSNIEGALRAASALIGGAVVIGNDRPYVTALLTLDLDAAEAFAARNGIQTRAHSDGDLSDLTSDKLVLAEIERAVAEANSHLSRVERVKRHTLLPVVWEPGGDEFTPTMKLRRKPIDKKYASEIEALYPVGRGS